MEPTEDLLQQVQVTPELSLSKAFANHWSEIEKTCLESIHIEAIPTDDLKIEQSKFGHYPWLPEGFEYPLDHEGNPMFLLAQLNFSEIPHLEGYPNKGILQFYISTSDEFVYGLDFNNTGKEAYRVVHFENVDIIKAKQDFPFDFKTYEFDNVPFTQPHALTFKKLKEYVGMGDIRGENTIVPEIDKWVEEYPKLQSDLETEAYEKFSYPGHKIGGYAYFTQQDPREDEEMILLFQMDSDENIMWGDAGVANFFIHPDDLKNKDFSKVLYNWDCS